MPPGDAQALANAIAEALAMSPADREALGARARANARRFSLAQMTQATLQVYARTPPGRPVEIVENCHRGVRVPDREWTIASRQPRATQARNRRAS